MVRKLWIILEVILALISLAVDDVVNIVFLKDWSLSSCVLIAYEKLCSCLWMDVNDIRLRIAKLIDIRVVKLIDFGIHI